MRGAASLIDTARYNSFGAVPAIPMHSPVQSEPRHPRPRGEIKAPGFWAVEGSNFPRRVPAYQGASCYASYQENTDSHYSWGSGLYHRMAVIPIVGSQNMETGIPG